METVTRNDAAERGMLPASSRLLGVIENGLTAIAAAGIFLMMLFGVGEIVVRMAFNISVAGYLDIAEQSLALFAFLGAAYTQRAGAHVRMEMLIGTLGGRALWALELFGTLIAIFVIAVIIRYSWDYFYSAYEIGDSTSDIEFPTWPSKLLVPVAFSVWLLRLAIQAAGFCRLLVHPQAQPVAVPTIKEAAELARQEIRETFGDDEMVAARGGAMSGSGAGGAGR